jgi:DNA-binding phage protein
MAKQKSLQRFTSLDDLKTVKQTKEYIEKNPDAQNDLWNNLSERLADSYKNNLGKEDVLTNMLVATLTDERIIEDIRNTTYEANNSKITSFIHNHILEHRCFPNQSTIIEKTKLSRQTVYNHLKDGINSKHNKLVKGANEIMSMSALQKLYLIGVQDNNPTALKHFIQLSGVVSNQNTTNVSNYIQINNLKISNEDFNKLPKETIIEIEAIVSKSIDKK